MNNCISKKKIALALALAGMAAGTAQAAQITANAQANVLTPLSITQNGLGMDFGNVAGDKDTASTVVLDVLGTTTSTDGAYASGTGAAASFTVAGAASATYTLTMPGSITLNGPGTAMTVDSFTYSSGMAGSRTLNLVGTETFQVGGTLHLGINQAAGAYTGTYLVTVAY